MESKDNLRLIVMENCLEFGRKVDGHIKLMRDSLSDHIIKIKPERFSNSEGKVMLNESVRGNEVYLLSDIGNYSCTYQTYGMTHHYGNDEHFADIKRVINAINGTAERITVVTPLLYESRQHRRKGMESLDAGMGLRELEFYGANGIITFDAHDPNVQNALHNCTFDNLYPTYSILKIFIENPDVNLANLLVISPDAGAIDRARYYADMLKTDVGIYHKRRDFSKVVNGKNPIVAHEYMGASVVGKDVLIVDDMIASGGSMLEVAKEMRERGANNIFLTVTFPLFSDGEKSVEAFNEAYKKEYFNKLYTTNLTYVPQYIKELPWFKEIDCSKYLAKIINAINNHESIEPYKNGKEKILKRVMEKRA